MVDGALTMSSQRLSKVAVAIGGFLIFVGIIMVGIFALVLFGVIDVSVLESNGYRMFSLGVLLVIGVLDLVSGVILRRG